MISEQSNGERRHSHSCRKDVGPYQVRDFEDGAKTLGKPIVRSGKSFADAVREKLRSIELAPSHRVQVEYDLSRTMAGECEWGGTTGVPVPHDSERHHVATLRDDAGQSERWHSREDFRRSLDCEFDGPEACVSSARDTGSNQRINSLDGQRMLDSMFAVERELNGVMESLSEGIHLSHGELLRLQSRTYAHMQSVDLLTKMVDRVAQGLRQVTTMQT